MWYFLMFLVIETALTEELLSNTFSVADQCVNLCKNAQLPPLELTNYEQIVCQRGCRFFNIIHFKDEPNLNTTKKECNLSCSESYLTPKEYEVCAQGCSLMVQQKQDEIAIFLIIEDENDSNLVLTDPELEILETDILSDPSIRSQLEIGLNIDYKIPETHIRTMPIKEGTTKKEYSGDWLDCASRNSGIPRWVLLCAILTAAIVALWLSFSPDKRDDDEEKLIVENEEEKPEWNELPPKYSIESEKV